jgi:hypothetical protein
MSREILDTSSSYPDKEIPEGTYTFTVHIVTKKDIKGKSGYEWGLEYDGKTVQVLMWPNQMGPLLRVLGVKEDPPNKFMLDTTELEGKKFTATAYKDKKGYQQLKDYKADDDIPF